MLEKMGEFFDRRIVGYEEHQLGTIEGAAEFYPYTASLLPAEPGAALLDLGCGTGLELGAYFARNPTARVTGIDLASEMLGELKKKFADKALTLLLGSYFDLPLGGPYDAAVSVESFHHFSKEKKIPLYRRIRGVLKDGGYLILTDYFAESDAGEAAAFAELARLKAAEGIADGDLRHFDTPLTPAHEMEALTAAGFTGVEVLRRWGATCTIKALK